jgi:hypothetical protein
MSEITRRNFLQFCCFCCYGLVGLTGFSILFNRLNDGSLIVTPPTPETDPDRLLERAEMGELAEFYRLTTGLMGRYGRRILDYTWSNCLKNIFDACDAAVNHGIYSEFWRSSNWGRDKARLTELAQRHQEESLKNITFILPQTDEEKAAYPDYLPPTKAEVINSLLPFYRVFPPLALVADGYEIDFRAGVGHYNNGIIRRPDPRLNPENSVVVDFHEHGHGWEILYDRLLPVMSLAEYAEVATETIRNSGRIADDWNALPEEDEKLLNKYGLSNHIGYLTLSDNDKYSYEFRFKLFAKSKPLFAPDLPRENTEKITPDDPQALRNAKWAQQSRQFNLIIHRAGQALLNDSQAFAGQPELQATAEKLMAMLFSEITHYLVGPYQVKDCLPDNYLTAGKAGIHVHNLAMHQTRMQACLAPDLRNVTPMNIREALELPPSRDPLIQHGSALLNEVKLNGKNYYLYKLPDSPNKEFYYLSTYSDDEDGVKSDNPGVLISLPRDYTEPLDFAQANPMGIELSDDRFINLLPINDSFTLLNNNPGWLRRIPAGYSEEKDQSNLGVVATNKIQLNGDVEAETKFLWKVNPDGKTAILFPHPQINQPVSALLFPDDSWSAQKITLLATDGEKFDTMEQLWPMINPSSENSPDLWVDEIFEQNQIILSDGNYNRFKIILDSNSYNLVQNIVFNNNISLATLEFVIDRRGDDNGELFIYLVFPNITRTGNPTYRVTAERVIYFQLTAN